MSHNIRIEQLLEEIGEKDVDKLCELRDALVTINCDDELGALLGYSYMGHKKGYMACNVAYMLGRIEATIEYKCSVIARESK